MREILFRGKRVDNGEWVYGSFLKQAGECISKDEVAPIEWWIYGMRGETALVDPKTVGQYTGLVDKYGTMLFEEDIIRDEDGDIMVVKWQSEGAVFVLEPKPYVSVHFYSTLPSKIEIIGNIHDDPELLEGI